MPAPTPHRLRSPRRSFVGLALVALVIAAAAGRAWAAPSTPDPTATSATPTPTATFPPTPTPTESPADLELAAQLAQGGQVDKATGALLAVVARGLPTERLNARIALAKQYLNSGSYPQAERQLNAYLLEAPASVDVRAAQFMLARAMSASGRDEAALPLYSVYLQTGGAAQTYARIGLAESLASTGQTVQAASEASAVLAQDLPATTRSAFDLQMALALEDASPNDAIVWYGRLRSDSSADSDQAIALWHLGLIEIATHPGANYAYVPNSATIIERYPNTSVALQVVEQGPTVRAMMDPYQVGLVYYYAGENDAARTAFERVISGGGSRAASAAFYLGALDERDGLNGDAIAHYGRVLQLDSTSPLAGNALWWQARLLEQAGRASEAAAAYQKLATDYPNSKFADDARFHVGLVAYDGGSYNNAADAFASIAKAARDDVRQRALLWQGKALIAARQSDSARTVLQTLQQEAPDGYYGLRAAVLLGEGVGVVRGGPLSQPAPTDWSALETWLNGGGQPLLAQQALFANPHWATGSALLSLGMTRQADLEFTLVLDRASRNPALLLELARYLEGAGMVDLSSRAAASLLAQLPDAQVSAAPADIWRLAYPTPFSGATNDAARAEEVPAVLLYALVRQESFFDPLAGSTAGALGLTQVVPATGAAIAADFKVAPFDAAQLFQPDTSLLFGAHYLRQQLDIFDGNIYAALAAYNAGPGSALRWQKVAGGDVDRFVAEIDFSQTESYVQLVTENLARYRQLYQGLVDPALPKD